MRTSKKNSPLYLHRNGQWAKKVLGKTYYFGTDEPTALRRWREDRDYLLAGCVPPSRAADEAQQPVLSELAIRSAGLQFEALQVRKQLLVNELDQIVPCHRFVVINLTSLVLRRGPAFPAILFLQNVAVPLTRKTEMSPVSLMPRIAVISIAVSLSCLVLGQEFQSVDEAFRSATIAHEARLAEWESLRVEIPKIKQRLAEVEKALEGIHDQEPGAPEFQPRRWQTVDLKFSTTATLLETDGRTAKLQKTDQQVVSVDREILVAADRIYIDEAYEKTKASKQKIEEWAAEQKRLSGLRDELSKTLKDAEAPKPIAPDRGKIEEEFELRRRGLEARPVAGSPNYFTAKLSDGTEIQIRLSSPVIYKLSGSPKNLAREFCQVLIPRERRKEWEDRDIWEQHGILNLNGTPVPVRKAAGTGAFSIEQVAEIGDLYTFNQPGRTYISILVGPHRIWVPFTITELPYREGFAAAKLLQDLGFPDQKATHFTSWPESKTFDGLFYSPSASESIIQAEHWRFKKFPYAVLAIVDDRLDDVGSYVEP